MSKKQKQGKDIKVGCLIIIIVFLIVISSGVLSKITFPDSREAFLKKLGFANTQEYEEFSQKLNADFDASLILVNVPTGEDEQNAKQKLSLSASLKNSGESIFDDDGNLKIEEVDEQGITLSNDLSFSDKEFASIINLFVVALDREDDEYAGYVDLLQVNYQNIDSLSATFNFFVDVNAAKLKEKFSSIADIIPNKMLFNIGFDLDISGETSAVKNSSFKMNSLDNATNEKIIDVLSIVFNKTHQEIMDSFK